LLVVRFNEDLARCPVLLDDEADLVGSRRLSTRAFRTRIQETERSLEPKGRERRMVRSALRLVVTANDVSDLRFADLTGADAIDAVADRIALIDVAPRAQAILAALAALRVSSDDYLVDLPAMVRHAAWVASTVAPPCERFIAGRGGHAAARAAILAAHYESHDVVVATLRDWLDTPDDAAPRGAAAAWSARTEGLCCDVRALADALAADLGSGPLEIVQAALRPARRGTVRPRAASGRRGRLWLVDTAHLPELEDDALEVLARRLSLATADEADASV
jgi:hypothetical protein